MKTANLSLTVLVSAITLATVASAWSQESLVEPQTLKQSIPQYVPADPYSVSVTWQPDGTLSVSPDWSSLAGNAAFKQMQLPPSIRATSVKGWLVGEFALRDSTWSPLFSVPDVKSEPVSPVSADPVVGASPKVLPTAMNAPATSATSTTEIADPLAVGASDPAFPASVTMVNLRALFANKVKPGCHRLFVNNVSGDDTGEGAMLHPQLGKLLKKGPLRTLAAARGKIQSGDEVVLVGTGKAYQWTDLNANSTDITLILVGDVTLEP